MSVTARNQDTFYIYIVFDFLDTPDVPDLVDGADLGGLIALVSGKATPFNVRCPI